MNFENDLLSSLPRHLSNDQALLCAMTLGEISFAVKNMNRNKSPGPYGLMVEFFRKFWDLLGGEGSRGGVLPYIGCIGMCGPKGYGFSAVLGIDFSHFAAILVINWVSIFAL